MNLAEYRERFEFANLARDEAGILLVRFHSDDGVFLFNPRAHDQLPNLFEAIGSDPENRAVVLTGTGDRFIDLPGTGLPGGGRPPVSRWDQVVRDGDRLVKRHLEIPVPIVAAVNGPATVHSEIVILADIVLCTPDTYFQDAGHVAMGVVPGDGMQVIWPMLLGPNRGRHFLLTAAKLSADDALAAGVVAEVVEPDVLLDRALELAQGIAALPPAVVRNTRYVLTTALRRAMDADLRAGLALEALAAIVAAEETSRT